MTDNPEKPALSTHPCPKCGGRGMVNRHKDDEHEVIMDEIYSLMTFKPPHIWLKEALTVKGYPMATPAAKLMGIDPARLLHFLRGRGQLTTEIAVKLEKHFNINARGILILQVQYNIFLQKANGL